MRTRRDDLEATPPAATPAHAGARRRLRGARRLLALLLCAAPIALACSRGGGANSGESPVNNGPLTPAEPAPPPPPSASAITPGACQPGPAFQLVPPRNRVLGAFRDPLTRRVMSVAVPEGGSADAGYSPAPQITLWAVSREGTTARDGVVELGPGIVPERAWRSQNGPVLVAFRREGMARLGRIADRSLLEVDLTGLGVTAENAGSIVPRDDPSSSRRAGVPLFNNWSYTASISVCDVDTESFHTMACGWDVRTPYLNQLLIAEGRSTIGPSPHGARAWSMLGRSAIFRPGRYWNGVPSGLDVAPTQPGPMTMAQRDTGIEAVAWVNRAGVLNVQHVSLNGTPEGLAVALPFVTPSLDDVAGTTGELLITATTRADAQSTPATTTLIRLNPSLPPTVPIAAPPIRVPIPNAHIVPLEGNEALLWSPDTGAALYLFCAPSA